MSGRKNRGKSKNRKGQSKRQRRRTQEKAGGAPPVGTTLLQKARSKDQKASLDSPSSTGQDRENSDPPAGPGPGVPRTGEAARAEPVGEGSPEPSDPPRPPHQIVRPYSIEAVLNPSVAIQFSEWCQKQEGVDLGIGVVEDYVGVADGDVGWHLRPGPDLTGKVSGGALKTLLSSLNPPSLIVQNMDQVEPLATILELPVRDLLNLVSGDVSQLLPLIDRGRGEPPYWSSPADAAYDAFVQEQHYSKRAPSFYRAVSVIRARQRAFYSQTSVEDEGLRWTIKFQDLFLRVVAHFSREPVLLMAFTDEQDPLARVMELLEVETEEEAMALIIWTMIGFDTPALSVCAPESYPYLPVSKTQEYMSLCERKLPVLANRYLHDREDFTRDRHLKTLYGLHTGQRKTVSEAVADRYFRSEQELLDVCAVAFWNDPEIVIAGTGWGGRTSSVNGVLVEGQKSAWHDTISKVGQAVDSHLSVKPASSLFWVDD